MNEVKHFTKASEIQHFAEVKVSQNDNVYGVTWAEVVKKYLQTAYSSEDAQAEVEAFGKTYKVLKRTEVTAFYDKDGNTLFDVTNERLQAEYEMLFTPDVTEPETAIGRTIASIEREAFERATQAYEQKKNEDVEDQKNDISEEVNDSADIEENENSAKKENVEENGEAEKEMAQNTPEENGEVYAEVDEAVEEKVQKSSLYIGVVGATTKLQEELKKAKEKEFAEPVIEYLIERCKESESLAADICQEHKTWDKCCKYVYEEARKKLSGKSGPVRDDVVFEWAEDYYRKDDKAEEEKKAKEEAERKKKQAEKTKEAKKRKEKAKGNKARADYDTTLKSGTDNHKLSKKELKDAKLEKETLKSKSKKNNDMGGQLSLFDMF